MSTYIIRDPATGYTEAVEGPGDVAYQLAAFPARATLHEIEWNDALGNFTSIDVTKPFVLGAIRRGDMSSEDEITHLYYDWPLTYVIGDQEYDRETGVAL